MHSPLLSKPILMNTSNLVDAASIRFVEMAPIVTRSFWKSSQIIYALLKMCLTFEFCIVLNLLIFKIRITICIKADLLFHRCIPCLFSANHFENVINSVDEVIRAVEGIAFITFYSRSITLLSTAWYHVLEEYLRFPKWNMCHVWVQQQSTSPDYIRIASQLINKLCVFNISKVIHTFVFTCSCRSVAHDL